MKEQDPSEQRVDKLEVTTRGVQVGPRAWRARVDWRCGAKVGAMQSPDVFRTAKRAKQIADESVDELAGLIMGQLQAEDGKQRAYNDEAAARDEPLGDRPKFAVIDGGKHG